MDLINKAGYNLHGLGAINVLVGKNGCGKSTLLRRIDEAVRRDQTVASVRYLTPERSGTLRYEPNIDNNMEVHATWLWDTRRKNQFGQFREQSVAQYRNLELVTLRRIQDDRDVRSSDYSFLQVVADINALLDNIEIRPAGSAFEIFSKDGTRIEADTISSGEAELISLAIEALVFEKEAASAGTNLLLMDEPDLHLHPDLQHRFARFVANRTMAERNVVLMATHSTSMIAALVRHSEVRLSFMRAGDRTLRFRPVGELHEKVLPVFGAHPLSQVFNESPILLVEGEDDERVWQQPVRTSNGALRLFPRATGGLPQLAEFEPEVVAILPAIYDEPTGFSLRDGDEHRGDELPDLPPLIRLRLNCRAAENLIVSDEVLESMGTAWPVLQAVIEQWIADNPGHQARPAMEAFQTSGFDRRQANLKELRNLLVALAGATKPWEVVVGSVLGRLTRADANGDEDSVYTYLGPKVVRHLLPQR
jgi:ABC-type multidrug transport system ATPase subunit